jgi:hypothetical protein
LKIGKPGVLSLENEDAHACKMLNKSQGTQVHISGNLKS